MQQERTSKKSLTILSAGLDELGQTNISWRRKSEDATGLHAVIARPACKFYRQETAQVRWSKSNVDSKQRGYIMQIAEQNNKLENSGQSGPIAATPLEVVRGTTGPRTDQGKQRSKHNALKHGIFSKVVLLKEEPRAEFDSLLRGLRNDLKPEGTLEELLVDKLATILWRKRRLLIAERAEIRKSTEFLVCNERKNQDDDAVRIFEMVSRELGSPGLLWGAENPIVLTKCLELLEILKEGIEKDGFNEKNDKSILAKLYGCSAIVNKISITLSVLYSGCVNRIPWNESGSQDCESVSLASCRSMFLNLLNEEINRLKRFGKRQALIDSNRIEIESLRGSVPDAPQLDRLLRYEANLERGFDRTLGQLERLQRIRRGQPVPPTLNVNVSV